MTRASPVGAVRVRLQAQATMFRIAIVALGLLAVLNPFCCCTARADSAAVARGAAPPPISGGCGCGLAIDEAVSAPPASQAPSPAPPAPCRHCASRIVKQAAGDKVTVPAIIASGTADAPWEPAGVPTDAGRERAVAVRATDPLHGVPPPPRSWTPRAKCALLI